MDHNGFVRFRGTSPRFVGRAAELGLLDGLLAEALPVRRPRHEANRAAAQLPGPRLGSHDRADPRQQLQARGVEVVAVVVVAEQRGVDRARLPSRDRRAGHRAGGGRLPNA